MASTDIITPTFVRNFLRHVNPVDGCWIWGGSTDHNQGYGRVWRFDKHYSTHRIMWQLIHGDIPKGMCVCHSCDNPPCVRPDHLWLGTLADNHDDMVKKGRHAHGDTSGSRLHPESRQRGETHYKAKLTEANVVEIRRRRANGELLRVIAYDFGISIPTVDNIFHRRIWKHLA